MSLLRRHAHFTVAVAMLSLSVAACGSGSAVKTSLARQDQLRLVADVPLPGNTSRFDYQSFDPQSKRLYVSHLGDSDILVFDTVTQKIVGDVKGVPGVHGVLAAPETGRLYASATDNNEVAVIDMRTLSIIATVPAGDYPDGLAYDPDVGKVFVSDERGGTVTVIDARTDQRVDTIQLGGAAGNTQYDPVGHRILVAVHSGQLVTIDPASDRITDRSDVPGCNEPHGLYVDAVQHAAFIGCQANAKLVVFDLERKRVTEEHKVGDAPDVLAFDTGAQLLYVASESGVVTTFAAENEQLRLVDMEKVADGAHSVAVNPDTHVIYLPLQNVGGHPVLREMTLAAAGAAGQGE